MRWILLPSILLLSACNDYQQHELVREVPIPIPSTAPIVLPPQPIITEDEAVKEAISWNPNIRIHIVRDQGYNDIDAQFRGVFHPYLQVTNNSATLAFQVDALSLYNLLVPEERAAWNNYRQAQRNQAEADSHQEEVSTELNVRIAFLEVARLRAQMPILMKEAELLASYYPLAAHTPLNDILFSITIKELNEHRETLQGQLAQAQDTLVRLIGKKPEDKLEYDFSKALLPTVPNISTKEMLSLAKDHSWLLKSLSASFTEVQYSVREAYANKWGKLALGPAFTVSPGNSFVGLSFRMSIPWPSNAADDIKNSEDQRLKTEAQYYAAVHDVEAFVHQYYQQIVLKVSSLNSPHKSLEDACMELDKEALKAGPHIILDVSHRLFLQELYQIDEIAHYKMNEILLESLIGTGIRK